MSMGKPMANYAAARRVGDFVFMSGVVAVDPATRRAVAGYDAIPEAARTALQGVGYATGQMSVDVFEAPIVAQSWFVLERIRQIAAEHGGTMEDVVKLVQYFRHLPHYAFYNRVRALTKLPKAERDRVLDRCAGPGVSATLGRVGGHARRACKSCTARSART